LYLTLRRQIRKFYNPYQIYPVRYQGQIVDEDTMLATTSFMFLFFMSFLVISVMLGMMGLDFMTALSASASAIANMGPGLGEVIGPDGTYGPLENHVKMILAFAMILGRLEFFTVLVLFTPHFWQR
jgi:trk system potassium uptake protein TrkH